MSLRNPEINKNENDEKLSVKDALIEKIAISFVALALLGFFLKLIIL